MEETKGYFAHAPMKFSIIIPCYNQAQYLPEAIESALEQTVEAEIIVVNDGSTDSTQEVAKRYPAKLVNKKNGGLSSARNAGIKKATGDYILPLDADDILMENCIERMVLAANQYNSDVIAPSFKSFGVLNGETILSRNPLTVGHFKEANRIGYFSAIKKSVLTEVGGYNKNMKWGYEDWNLWIDIFKRGHSLCVIPEVLVLYRTKEHSMIHDANAHREELIEQIKKNHPEVYV
jgi:cellulose synthase/poly-beta-1,6-N-acetylglucosamine synthase-like glycosyltransferase